MARSLLDVNACTAMAAYATYALYVVFSTICAFVKHGNMHAHENLHNKIYLQTSFLKILIITRTLDSNIKYNNRKDEMFINILTLKI